MTSQQKLSLIIEGVDRTAPAVLTFPETPKPRGVIGVKDVHPTTAPVAMPNNWEDA